MIKVIIGDKELSEQMKRDLYLCISCRLGFIETGEVSMRAIDAQNSGQLKKIKALSLEQKQLTIDLEKLMYSLI